MYLESLPLVVPDKAMISKRLCVLCNGKTYIRKNGEEHWYKYNGEFICTRCYGKDYRKRPDRKQRRGRRKHNEVCYCCGGFETRHWCLNLDIDGNVLCEKCERWLYKKWHNARTIRARLLYRKRLFDILGRVCMRCGYSENILALEFDHINGDGARDRRERGSSPVALVYYARHPDDARKRLQVYCANCNRIKRHEEGSVNTKGYGDSFYFI